MRVTYRVLPRKMGCSSGSVGTVSPPQGDNNAGGRDHAGGHH